MSLVVSAATIEADGFAWARNLTPSSVLNSLERDLSEIVTEPGRAGVRDLLRRCAAVCSFARSSSVVDALAVLLGQRPFAVRGILFDKTLDANWRVTWHQDLTIAVREQRDARGFGPWSVKEGIPHVQAPTALLGRMLTLRLHLDDCDESSGAIRVIPGSHRHGKLSAAQIDEWKQCGKTVVCTAGRGDALIMRPLLLHASSPAISPLHRRVIHIEFAVDELPCGLAWAERISK